MSPSRRDFAPAGTEARSDGTGLQGNGDSTSRRGRGKSQKSIKLINAVRRILETIQPASLRAVCYQLFILKIISSMSKKDVDAVGVQVVWARENGLIPWGWIVDETREVERVAAWDSPEDIIRAAVDGYRKNYHHDQPNRIQVVSEKGTMRGALKPVLDEYGIDFRVMHGFGSATTVHDIAEYSADSEKPLILIYVGDWDSSGLFMSERDLPERIDRYGGHAEIVRVALNELDVGDGTELPSFPLESKAKDPRHNWFKRNYGDRCWEVDALSPVTLRERVEATIVEFLDIDAWTHSMQIERAERESMSTILASGRVFLGKQGNTPGELPDAIARPPRRTVGQSAMARDLA